jgi:hypothetical protein
VPGTSVPSTGTGPTGKPAAGPALAIPLWRSERQALALGQTIHWVLPPSKRAKEIPGPSQSQQCSLSRVHNPQSSVRIWGQVHTPGSSGGPSIEERPAPRRKASNTRMVFGCPIPAADGLHKASTTPSSVGFRNQHTSLVRVVVPHYGGARPTPRSTDPLEARTLRGREKRTVQAPLRMPHLHVSGAKPQNHTAPADTSGPHAARWQLKATHGPRSQPGPLRTWFSPLKADPMAQPASHVRTLHGKGGDHMGNHGYPTTGRTRSKGPVCTLHAGATYGATSA